MPRAALLLIALIAAATPSPAAAQDIAELVGPTDEIPRNSYRSWALFLVCNPDWVTERRSGDLANLYWAFKRFGDAIGPRNLAVWFWKEQMRVTDPRLGDNVNVARAAAYCSSLSLIPSRGPFIVITTGHPGADSVPPAHGIFELGDLQPEQIGKLLLRLTDVLMAGRAADTFGAGAAAVAADDRAAATGFWIRMLEGARQSIIGFGCAVSVRISTGVFSAELRECAGP